MARRLTRERWAVIRRKPAKKVSHFVEFTLIIPLGDSALGEEGYIAPQGCRVATKTSPTAEAFTGRAHRA